MIYCLIFLSICGCRNIEPKNIENNNSKHEANIKEPLDSLMLVKLLYGDKKVLESQSLLMPFSIKSKFSHRKLFFDSKGRVNGNEISYNIVLKSNITSEKFNWSDDGLEKCINASISFNNSRISIIDSIFVNNERKVYPAGIWHWSVGDIGSAKLLEYNGKIYILLNGANLFCNGNNCTSYQLYILIYDKTTKQLIFNAIETEGKYPYLFSSLNLFDKDGDNLPDFYIVKNNIDEITGIEDFELYSFNKQGKVIKK